MDVLFGFLFLLAIFGAVIWICRVFGPWSGWAQSAQCQRCGFIIHHFDYPVWSGDKTCQRCGPHSTWKRVVARPVGLFGYEVKE